MRDDVLKKLLHLRDKFNKQDGVNTSFSDGKTSVIEITKDATLVSIKLYSEPLPTSYFNIDLLVQVDGSSYCYTASEREYTGTDDEIHTIDEIIQHVLSGEYKLIKKKIFWRWVNAYMDIEIDGEETVSLLKTRYS